MHFLKCLTAIVAVINLLAVDASLALSAERSFDQLWYRTSWFRALCGVAVLVVLWLLYRLWMQRMEVRYRSRLEAQLSERMRIARELHDTLLQGMHGILLRFQDIANRLPDGHPTAELMEQALQRADAVLIEGRDRVRDLRQPTASEQPPAQVLSRLASELSQESGPRYRVFVSDTVRALHPVVHEEAMRIGAEALRNAFRHSQARQVEIDVAYERNEFRLRIRDNGRGMAADIVSHGRTNHFGLRGMRERAARIGGRLDIWSELDIGTEIELRVSSGIAYVAASRVRRRDDQASGAT